MSADLSHAGEQRRAELLAKIAGPGLMILPGYENHCGWLEHREQTLDADLTPTLDEIKALACGRPATHEAVSRNGRVFPSCEAHLAATRARDLEPGRGYYIEFRTRV